MTRDQLKQLEADLWSAANNLRANSDLKSSEYSTPVLGLIFLKFADNNYRRHEAEIIAEYQKLKGTRREKKISDIAIEKCGFYLPDHARYDYLLNLPEEKNIAKALKEAMKAVEEYKPELEGVLPKDDYFRLTRDEKTKTIPNQLLKTFADIPSDFTGDLFGQIYEYFLAEFARSEGSKGGEFFTPRSVVRLMVEMIEPHGGKVFDRLTFGQDPDGPTTFAGNTFAIADTFTWVKGHNTWKFGAGISAYQQNTLYAFFTDGLFSFAGSSDGGDGTGNSLADFLVGAPNNLFEGPDAANNIRSKTTYGFAQDEWRVHPNLTLTLGIRYEYSTPKLDTAGRTFSIIPGDQSVKFPNAPLGLVFPGDPGAPRGVNFPDKKNFAPRIGFAWSPGSNSKTSIRGGFGIFYDVLKGEDNLQFNGAPPFYSEPYVVFPCLASAADPTCTSAPYTSATPFYSAPWANSTTPFTSNPFPSKPPNPSTAFNTCTSTGFTCPYYNFLPAAGGSIYFVNPHLYTPYIYQYNLSVQHKLQSNLIAEANYVGSSSKGLTSLVDVNPFDLNTISGSSPARILNEHQNANLTAYCASQGGPSDCPLENAYQFGNVAFANFSSLEASLTKQNGANRIIGNTYFTLAYTYGHSIDNASGFRNRDSQVPYYEPGIFRASSDFDVRQRITFSGGWDLPFDRAWASGPKRLVKGWSLYPIFSWRTGFPLSISSELLDSFSPSDPGPSGAGDGYLANANYAPGFSKITILNPKKQASCSNSNTGLTDTGNLYFNCAAFVGVPDIPGSGYGNTGRDFFRGPGRTNLDLALAKTTAITERMSIEFRLEAFNLFNHTQFANPDTNIDDATFGEITSTTLGTGITAMQTQRIVQLAARLSF